MDKLCKMLLASIVSLVSLPNQLTDCSKSIKNKIDAEMRLL